MSAADHLDRYRVRALVAELERLAIREREIRDELREILDPRRPDHPGLAGLRERFGGKPA